MVGYRRNRIAGGTYFFTATLRDRQSTVLVDYVDMLRAAIDITRNKLPFSIDAIVILPDHLHAIWILPEGDSDYPSRWKMLKSNFTQGLRRNGIEIERDQRGEYALWQRRYWEHTIRDDSDMKSHVDYIHYNPVKHGLVEHVGDWPHSSFHQYVEKGSLPRDWACGEFVYDRVGFGE